MTGYLGHCTTRNSPPPRNDWLVTISICALVGRIRQNPHHMMDVYTSKRVQVSACRRTGSNEKRRWIFSMEKIHHTTISTCATWCGVDWLNGCAGPASRLALPRNLHDR